MGNIPGPAVLRAVQLRKAFGHVHALDGVDFELRAGEVVGLVGDNGAGKSTLVKCLCGVYEPDDGRLEVDGTPVSFHAPVEARKLGIETVFQDLALAPDLSVALNVFLGRELRRSGLLGRLGFLDFLRMKREALGFVAEIGIDLPSVDVKAEELSGGQRQGVAIARARSWASRVLLLDEPTAALGVRQTEIVLDIIRASRANGIAIMVISHDLPSILKVADRLVVMRQGRVAAELPGHAITYEAVVGAMLGKEVSLAG